MRIFLLLLVFSTTLLASSQSLEEIRKNFHTAVLDPENSKQFHEFLEDVPLDNSTVKAYKAVSEAMLARAVWNPFTKLSQVMKYDELISMAIAEEDQNIEIRFLRLAIEYNLPRFLGMSKHLVEDRDVIVKNMTAIETMSLDPSFGRYILYFLNDTGLCTETQIAEMQDGLDRLGGE